MRGFNLFFHRSHFDQRKAETTAGKGGYIVTVQNIYNVLPPPPGEHHEATYHTNTIFQVIQMQIHKLEGLAQSNAILTSSNMVAMVQLAQMKVTMNSIHMQLKTLAALPTN